MLVDVRGWSGRGVVACREARRGFRIVVNKRRV